METQEQDPVTREIIGAAMEVLNALGPGLDERIYHRALVLELRLRGLAVESERQYPVHYKLQPVGVLIPDLVVANAVVVECKVVPALTADHFAQLFGYLAITQLPTGLFLNFHSARLTWKRIIRRPDAIP